MVKGGKKLFCKNSCYHVSSCCPHKAKRLTVDLLHESLKVSLSEAMNFSLSFLRSKLKMEDIKEVNKALKVLDY